MTKHAEQKLRVRSALPVAMYIRLMAPVIAVVKKDNHFLYFVRYQKLLCEQFLD
jgi:hypothetical protein